jgi:Zn-dependent peptidase ImmA (M78 family)
LGSIADSEDYQGINASEEREANLFAVEILMPEDKVREIFLETMRNQSDQNPSDQKTLAIEEMAKMFQVSKASMRIRLQSLGLI